MVLTKWTLFLHVISLIQMFYVKKVLTASPDFITRLAVVVDVKFKGIDYKNFPTRVKQFLTEETTQHLKHGELKVDIFTSIDINFQEDTMAVLSILHCEDTWSLYRNFQDEHMLHMAITEADCPRLPKEDGITVPIVSVRYSSSQVMLDIKTSQLSSWTSCNLVYDNSVDSKIVEKIIKSLSTPSIGREKNAATVSVFKIEGSNMEWERRRFVMKLLKDLPTRILGSNFVVAVGVDLVGILMEASKSLGLSNPENQWLYLISDMNSLSHNMSAIISLLTEGENIAFAYNTTSTAKSCKTGLHCHIEEILNNFIIALDKILEDETEIMEQVSSEEWKFIRPSKNKRRHDILHLMNIYMINNGHCDNCSFWTLVAGDTWGLDYLPTVQNNSQSEGRHLIPVGTWTPQNGIQVVGHLFPHTLQGFGGRNLPIVTFHDPPWQIISYNESSPGVVYKGLMFQILNEMAKHLNFSYTVMIPANNKDGWSDETNINKENVNTTTTFIETDRIIELIREKKVFLAVGAFTVTERRKSLVNFTIPIYIQASALLTSRPGEVSRALIFIAPFSCDTWVCIVVLMVTVTPILNYFHRHSPYYEYHYGRSIRQGLNSLYNCLWYVYGALMQQGGMHLPEADSGRILVGAWWLVVLVIVTSYGGNLVAFLTFPRYQDAITNVEQLIAHKGSVSWGIPKDSPVEDHLKDLDDPNYRRLLQGSTLHEMQNTDMLSRVRSGSHVFVDWKLNLLFLMKREFAATNRCDFALGEEEFLEDQVAMMMELRSPYIGLVNEQLRRLQQSGLIYKWYEDHLPRKDRCWTTSRIMEATTHTVNLDDMQGSFFVLGLGCACAVIVIFMEQCYHHYNLLKEKKVVKPFKT